MSYPTYFWTSSDSRPGCVCFPEDDSPGEGQLTSGGWSVPILWSMCFGGEDVNVLELPKDAWSLPDEPAYGASCDAPIPGAVAQLQRRLPSLKAILTPSLHLACDMFASRMRRSQRSHVHMDVSLLLENEDNPADRHWKQYWAGLLNGLDTPVARVRSGIWSKLLGLGLPPGWKYLCSWALSNQPLHGIRAPDLDMSRVTGAVSLRHLDDWQP